jgi:hypothetical protein
MRDDQVVDIRSAPNAQHMLGELVMAVFIQALRDAAGKNNASIQAEAREWLLSEDGELYAWVVGVDLYRLRSWVAADCLWPRRGR